MPSICTRLNRRIRLSGALPVVAAALVAVATVSGATFGTVVPIGGHASDIALDEARGVVYVANYTANRIDVVSVKSRTVQSSINVAPQPASLALSPDGRYLLVAHYSNFKAPATSTNSLTVLDLSGNGNLKQTFAFGAPPLGVAFGNDGLALVATMTDFVLFDPASGYSQTIDTVTGVSAKVLPVPPETMPREIISASLAASGDGTCIWGTVEAGDQNTELLFRYDTQQKAIGKAVWVASPPPGPRVMSTNKDGTLFLASWGLYHQNGFLLAQFPEAWGNFNVGTHAFDTARNLIYAQMPKALPKPVTETTCSTVGGVQVCVDKPGTLLGPVNTSGPVLLIVDADNLAVREQLKLQENLTGRSLLDARGDYLYAGSDSGLVVLPVGLLSQQHRVVAQQEDVVFRGNWCDRRFLTQEFSVVNPGGGKTDFSLSTSMAGIGLTVNSATTPARVQVVVDMGAYQNIRGTVNGVIEIKSAQGVNIAPPVRVLVNNREPDQRGTFFNVPGKLVDVVADPVRNRFYIVRQDKNQVLVYDAGNFRQIGTLRTGNTPMQAVITFDKQYLITTADNSQVAHVYNLDTLQLDRLIVFPGGHYPHSIAASARGILAACRVAGPKHKIDRVEMWGVATELPSLGIWENDVHTDTVLVASPSGSTIMAAQPDGRVWLYDANADTFTVSRRDFQSLSGAAAALADNHYVVDNYLLNASLVPVMAFETGSGSSSGFAMADTFALRTAAPSPASPGVVQRIDMSLQTIVRPTRMTEAPVLPASTGGFVRTLAPLANRNAIVSLTTSGFTVLPWNYDAAVADPKIESVVNAADRSANVAPGGLITILGKDLSPVNAASNEIPLPTALGDSCLTVNGALVPMIFVSPSQINGQLPFNITGAATMILRTPSGVSNSYLFNVKDSAPGVFRATLAGLDGEVPTVVRATNDLLVTLANPVHLDDVLVIYLTGMGKTMPEVGTGMPGPADPLAEAQLQPEVTLGGVPVPVFYAGMAPGEVGVYQINVRVPFKGVPTGMEVPLTIKQGETSTTINVRVVH